MNKLASGRLQGRDLRGRLRGEDLPLVQGGDDVKEGPRRIEGREARQVPLERGPALGLSRSAMLASTARCAGTVTPAAMSARYSAPGRVVSCPITSPVEVISGPSSTSTCPSFSMLNTGAFTAIRGGGGSSVTPG